MNGPGADIPSRRVEDQGTRRGRITAWVRRWKDPIIMVVLIPTAVVAFWAAVKVKGYNEQQAHDQKIVLVLAQQQAKIARDNAQRAKDTAASARLQCLRTKAFAPAVADDYERRGVLPSSVLDRYRASIPKTCPPG